MKLLSRSLSAPSLIAFLVALLLIPGCDKKEPEAAKQAPPPASEPAAPQEEEKSADIEAPGADAESADAGEKPVSIKERRAAPKDVAAAPASAQKTKSGVAWIQLQEGKGDERAERDDTVWVNYSMWTPDGKLKSTSFKLKGAQPRQLSFVKTIPGWKEMLKDMAVGERRLVWVPKKLAYPKRVPKNGTDRVVDLELMKLKKAPKAPADVKKPPKDAKKTKTGLRYRELKAGTGTVHPSTGSLVTVRYAGWTRKGICFDSTGPEEKMSFALNAVIKGWTEGLQLMVEGQKMRFWIPQDIAYDGMSGKPKGQLTFDVELISIDK